MARIAITGTHGVGKTTLCKELEKLEVFKNYAFIEEVARKEIIKIGKMPTQLCELGKVAFQFSLLSQQMLLESDLQNFISDRSIFDTVGYSYDLIHQKGIQIKEIAKYWHDKQPYDFIFYVPIEFALEADAQRLSDIEYQAQIDANIVKTLHELNINYIPITGDIQTRIQMVLDYLKIN